MKRCARCPKPVPVGVQYCQECAFIQQVATAGAIIIIVGAALIAVIGR